MLSQKNKAHKKTNPKRRKRHPTVDVGKPQVPLGQLKQIEHEKLSDWADAS